MPKSAKGIFFASFGIGGPADRSGNNVLDLEQINLYNGLFKILHIVSPFL